MKENVSKFKEIWSNPRYKSLIILGLYFLFFAVIIIYSKIASSSIISPDIELTALEKLKVKSDYQFSLKIDDQIIDGQVENDVLTFNYKDKKYTYENEIINPTDFEYQTILKYIYLNKIYDLINNQEIYSKTEFNDNTLSKTYKLDDMVISTYEKNNNIFKIEIETNEYKFEVTYF